MQFFGGDPGVPVIVDGKETFPLVPVAVGLFSTVFNVFNTLLFPFIGVFERVLSRIGHTAAEDIGGLFGAELSSTASSSATSSRPCPRSSRKRAVICRPAPCSSTSPAGRTAPSDPGEHYLATDILSRDIRTFSAALFKDDMPHDQLDLVASLIEEADFTAASPNRCIRWRVA